MKIFLSLILPFMIVYTAIGQGTFIYDQQSSMNEMSFPNGSGAFIQLLSPYGQSFTPTLSAIDFIRLNLDDNNPNNGIGATLYLNLRTGDINGTILATTPSVTLANGFTGTMNFFFSSDVPLTPGDIYTFQIVVQSGDSWNAIAGEYNYSGGMAFANGVAASGSDLWFREGVLSVPEPSPSWLVLLGSGIFLYARRAFHR